MVPADEHIVTIVYWYVWTLPVTTWTSEYKTKSWHDLEDAEADSTFVTDTWVGASLKEVTPCFWHVQDVQSDQVRTSVSSCWPGAGTCALCRSAAVWPWMETRLSPTNQVQHSRTTSVDRPTSMRYPKSFATSRAVAGTTPQYNVVNFNGDKIIRKPELNGASRHKYVWYVNS